MGVYEFSDKGTNGKLQVSQQQYGRKEIAIQYARF
jgi:hypothetical protein